MKIISSFIYKEIIKMIKYFKFINPCSLIENKRKENKMDEEIIKEIDDLVNFQLKEINGLYFFQIRDVYKNDYQLPELMVIKAEICKCITLGLYIAAMTLINHLLEKSIKLFLIYSDTLKNKNKDGHIPFEMIHEIEVVTPKYDNNNLSKNIETALNNRVITEEEKVILDKMRVDFRNAYSHSDRRKMYKDNSVQVTEVNGVEQSLDIINGKDDNLPKKDVKIVNIPMMDFLFIHQHAKENCVPYIIKLDKIITNEKNRLMPNSETKS